MEKIELDIEWFRTQLKKILKTKKITQKELADLIGTKQVTISDWLNKKRQPKSLPMLFNLISFYLENNAEQHTNPMSLFCRDWLKDKEIETLKNKLKEDCEEKLTKLKEEYDEKLQDIKNEYRNIKICELEAEIARLNKNIKQNKDYHASEREEKKDKIQEEKDKYKALKDKFEQYQFDYNMFWLYFLKAEDSEEFWKELKCFCRKFSKAPYYETWHKGTVRVFELMKSPEYLSFLSRAFISFHPDFAKKREKLGDSSLYKSHDEMANELVNILARIKCKKQKGKLPQFYKPPQKQK